MCLVAKKSKVKSPKIKRTNNIKCHLLFILLYSVFGCQENPKEKPHLLLKETQENPNGPNPITPPKVQNSTTTSPKATKLKIKHLISTSIKPKFTFPIKNC